MARESLRCVPYGAGSNHDGPRDFQPGPCSPAVSRYSGVAHGDVFHQEVTSSSPAGGGTPVSAGAKSGHKPAGTSRKRVEVRSRHVCCAAFACGVCSSGHDRRNSRITGRGMVNARGTDAGGGTAAGRPAPRGEPGSHAGVGRRDGDALQRQVELLGDQHRRGRRDALPDLGARQRERRGAVRVDADGDQARGGSAASVGMSLRSYGSAGCGGEGMPAASAGRARATAPVSWAAATRVGPAGTQPRNRRRLGPVSGGGGWRSWAGPPGSGRSPCGTARAHPPHRCPRAPARR